ncbi:MAG TPA: ABC transporter ATP-binding protein [Sphingomicrobium sp.]|nr:ABC transporter ATP-binding protein [Sphingomicrobium sp.]
MTDEQQSSARDQAGLRSGLRELYGTLTPQRRRQFYFVLVLMFAGALAELATIGAVLPFLSLLADPGRIGRIPALAAAFNAVGAVTNSERLLAATVLFILLAIIAALVRLQLTWSSQNFIFRLGHELAVNIQRRILFQPYTFHINQNTSTLVASLEKVGTLVYYVLLQLMQAAIAVIISIFIIAALIYVDPFTALVSAAAFGLIYLLVSTLMRRRLDRNSDVIGATWDERVKIVQESLGGIRDVIIDSSQPVYLEAFRKIDDRFSNAKTNTAFIGAAPRFIIESLGMSLIAILAIVMAARQGGLAAALPILGALALGAQRLLPMLQQIYVSWSVAVGNQSLINQVLELVRLPVDEETAQAEQVAPLPFRRHIRLENVSFAYPSRRVSAVDDISFEIGRGQRMALIGKTGSGKSTLADLLMGLLEPIDGRIVVDGVSLTRENRRNWQRSIAHVPQAIFLADASIARNIALGVPAERIDTERVIEAAKKAQLDEFVRSLPEGYDSFVGERGIRLSGGQRQRLGIARAIYKQAPVLVLDEATSALDDATESDVMRALDQLGEEGRTIILIAHRLSTISRADLVVRLENGRLVELGSYSEVIGAIPQSRAF